MPPAPLARLLLDRFRWFDDALRQSQRDELGLDITPAQSLLFAELPRRGMRQADLARRLGVSRQAINELVAGLQKQDLVSIDPDPSDGRARLVRPTETGLRSISVARRALAAQESALRDRVGSAAFADLRAILEADWGD